MSLDPGAAPPVQPSGSHPPACPPARAAASVCRPPPPAPRSYFAAAQSDPRNGRFMFVYKIVVVNESDQIVQLRQRHWVIMDANGKTEEVRRGAASPGGRGWGWRAARGPGLRSCTYACMGWSMCRCRAS